jgi:hypothetical protein
MAVEGTKGRKKAKSRRRGQRAEGGGEVRMLSRGYRREWREGRRGHIEP